MSARTPPKKPVMTAQTASARQACKNTEKRQIPYFYEQSSDGWWTLEVQSWRIWWYWPVSYLAGPTWKGNPCSQTPLWYLRCSLSTGWSSSWRWSGRCSPPRRTSSTQWEEWNTLGSSHTDRTQSSQSPCTSRPSGTSWWGLLLHHSVRIWAPACLPAVGNCHIPPLFGILRLVLCLSFQLIFAQ